MDTYKQICAKLVEAWDSTADGEYEDFGRAASYLVNWTRDALAEPEPEEPTDGELVDAYWEGWNECSKRDNKAAHAAGLRAVLARWGK